MFRSFKSAAAGAGLAFAALATTQVVPAVAQNSTSAATDVIVLAQGNGISLQDIRSVLRKGGYRGIRFTDRKLPRYAAEACRDRVRYRLQINRWGEVRDRERLGKCRPAKRRVVDAKQLRERLRARGFNRIRFAKRTPPVFTARACKLDRRFTFKFDKFGKVTERRRVGKCGDSDGGNAKAPSFDEIKNLLKARRYYQVRFTNRTAPVYVADACRNRKAFKLRLSRWGDIRGRRQTGSCEAPGRGFFAKPAERRRLNVAALRGNRRIDADECQDYFEGLLSDNTINFASGSARVESRSFDLLDQLSFVAARCPETLIEIAGHTDSDGSRSSNQRLSRDRALSVVKFLRQKGVPRTSLRAVGYGEDRPIASNSNSTGRRLNRRIEFVVNWGE